MAMPYLEGMKHLIVAALVATAAPAAAQVEDESPGFDLMEEGSRLFMRCLMNEMAPALRELEGLADEVGPAMRLLADEMGPRLAEILSTIDDIRNYDAPEILPNGDIIIRRRTDAPVYEPEGEIEL